MFTSVKLRRPWRAKPKDQVAQLPPHEAPAALEAARPELRLLYQVAR
jgi:hypothetical protein